MGITKEHIAIGKKKEKEIVTPLATLPSAAMADANWKQNMRSKQHHREITSFFSKFLSLCFSLANVISYLFLCAHHFCCFSICAFVTLCYLLPFFVLVVPRIPTDVPFFTFCYCCC